MRDSQKSRTHNGNEPVITHVKNTYDRGAERWTRYVSRLVSQGTPRAPRSGRAVKGRVSHAGQPVPCEACKSDDIFRARLVCARRPGQPQCVVIDPNR